MTSEDRNIFRNFMVFAIVLLFLAGLLGYVFASGDEAIEKTTRQVTHTQDVIFEAQKLAALIEGMQSSQRGYLITGSQIFLDRYEEKKKKAGGNVLKLWQLTRDNSAQQERLKILQKSYEDYADMLDERTKRIAPLIAQARVMNENLLANFEKLDSLKTEISSLNESLLQTEYTLLNQRVSLLERKKDLYLRSLMTSLAVGVAVLLLFNAFVLSSQSKSNRFSRSLRETQDRLALAIDGTQDGIFDWDVATGKIFYSRRYFEIIGYDYPNGCFGSPEDALVHLHPDDRDRVWNAVQQYLNQKSSEFNVEFRMRHKAGHWIWIQSKAKGIFDADKKPLRLVGAHADITHLKIAQEKLEAEKKQVEETSRAKSDFMAHMSHEIRTPLTVISGVAEILEKKQNNFDEKQKQLVRTLNASTSSLKDLVNDILDLSKIESGELELLEASFPIAELFEEVVSMMSLRALEKGLKFTCDYESVQGHDFYGDKARLRQVLVNLVGNAIKFTDKGRVTIRARFEVREDLEVFIVDVIDTGIGIAAENLDMIFDRFKQADSSVSRKYGGTGLGLSISRNLIHMMGGEILLSSTLGAGSTFTAIVPACNPLKKSTERNDRDLSLKLNDRIRSVARRETKILLVEDYEGNIVVIGYFLEDLGLVYDVARTGAQGLELWKSNHYDIVLMDVQMPEMDGFTATQEIRAIEARESLARTPIIGMTAHALVGDKDKCIESGMDAYLPKPIVESDLKKEIFRHLDRKKEVA